MVIDVGGGFGNVTKVIAKAFPSLRYTVQDRAATIEEAAKVRTYYLAGTTANLRTPVIALGSRRSSRDIVRASGTAR